jgi:uncharacterized membrane protein YdfJ with MMPL/SSD domain
MNPEDIQRENETPAEEFILGPPADPESASERFYAGAILRVRIAIVALGIAGFAISSVRFGFRSVLGFAIGLALSWWNFQSLVWAVTGLAGRIVEGHEGASGGSLVFRFIVRIPLVALAGYAIFISSPGSLRGFLVGLCVPIAAIFFEVGYEAFAALRRGF